ncbi:MAG: hypothetical protein WA814_03840 [Candidatus Baltobacteraceae bacterium]
MRRVALLAFLCWLAASSAAWADCKLHQGEHVVLYSTTDDPSVFLWDSRVRLRDYSAASFDEAQALLPHAVLVAPGTHANVLSCVPNYVTSPILQSPDDAVGVVIVSGPSRGFIRWVLGTDVRPLHKTHP